MNQLRPRLIAPSGMCSLIAHAWASNRPHPSAPADNRPDDADPLDLLLDWAPDEKIRCRIRADNPAELFGFVRA